MRIPESQQALARIMDFLHAGDELVVVKLDRLGRSTRDMLNLVHELEAKGENCGLDLASLPCSK